MQIKPLITKGKPAALRLKKTQKMQKMRNVYTATVAFPPKNQAKSAPQCKACDFFIFHTLFR